MEITNEVGDNKYLVEHLEWHPTSQNDFWWHPNVEDIQTITIDQI